MSEPKFVSGADAMASWRDDLLSGTPPVLYRVGVPSLDSIEIGPGLVTLIGGAPGSGKTALTLQFVFDALRLNPSLRCVVCNVEMSAGELLNRQLARVSGIDLTTVRHRQLNGEHAERLEVGLATLDPLVERLAFLRSPFDLANCAAVADAFRADLILLDYVQRIPPPGEFRDARGSVNAVMDYLRRFADAGTAVLVVSAVGRGKDAIGRSTYDSENLGLASFKESGELEFGADSAYILAPRADGSMALKCLKNRHGAPSDIRLAFDRSIQRFTYEEPF